MNESPDNLELPLPVESTKETGWGVTGTGLILVTVRPDSAPGPLPPAGPTAGSAVGVADPGTGHWLCCSETFANALGLRRQQLIGSDWRQLLSPDSLASLRPALSGGLPTRLRDAVLRSADGRRVPVWIGAISTGGNGTDGASAPSVAIQTANGNGSGGGAAAAGGMAELSQTTLDALPHPVAVLDEAGTVIVANRAWSQTVEPSTAVGASYLQACWEAAKEDPGEAGLVLLGLKTVLGGRQPEAVGEYSRGEEADRRWWNWRAALVSTAPRRVVVSTFEVTAARRAEQAADNARIQIRAMAAAMSDGFVAIDAGGWIVEANGGFAEQAGYSAGELKTMRWSEILEVAVDGLLPTRGQVGLATTGGRTEGKLRCRDGTTREVEVRSTVLSADEGGLALCSVRNLGERRAANERIRVLLGILDQASEAIVLRNLAGRILYLNAGAERLFGWKREEALGQLTAPGIYLKPEEHEHALETVLAAGEWQGELAARTRCGREIFVESRWSLARDDGGRPRSVLMVNTDVTERKNLRMQLNQAQRHEGVGTLAAGIAHDLNNLLTPLVMGLPYLRGELTAAERDQMINALESSAGRAVSLITQLRGLSRAAGNERAPMEIRLLLRELAKMLKETFPRSITVVPELQRTLWRVKANLGEMHQALINFCIRSRDAMPGGGTLTIRAENLVIDDQFVAMNPEVQLGPRLRIRVEDTGEGLSDEVRAQLLGAAAGGRDSEMGAILGVSTAIRIIRSHGGFIRCESHPREGTVFELLLPALTDPAEPKAGSPPPTAIRRGNGEVILVVDDEPNIRQASRRTLEAQGYRVVEAQDGVEAAAVYAERMKSIAVVVTDLMMPVMDGTVLCRALRRLDPSARIIVCTGLPPGRNADSPGSLLGDLGASQLLIKPFTGEALLRAVGDNLRADAASPAPL
ncbi:MAG: hybrid sensor histidine kinase/response regulator [Limisphaerales bacterium]